jgi:hypothetical protein
MATTGFLILLCAHLNREGVALNLVFLVVVLKNDPKAI